MLSSLRIPALRAAVLGLSIVSLVACSQASSSSPGDFGVNASAIQGGVENTNDPAVVGILTGGAMCSGSLIAPNLVLTAQHCVADINSAYVDCEESAFGEVAVVSSIVVTTEWDGILRYYQGEHVKFHYAAEVLLPAGANEVCGRDVALIRLGGDGVPPTDALPINPRVDFDVARDEPYRAVGYGSTSASGGGAGVRRVREDLVVKCAGDCLTSSIVENKEWIGDTGICSGDSGGPALDLQGRVIGVVSRGGNWGDTCAMPVYGSVFGWADWIKEQAAIAADKGGYEPAPWVTGSDTLPETDAGALVSEAGADDAADAGASPDGGGVGAACSSQDQCVTGICATATTPGYCTLACSELAPACPSSMLCDPDLGFCVTQDASDRCGKDSDCLGSSTCDVESGTCEGSGTRGDGFVGGGCVQGRGSGPTGSGPTGAALLALVVTAGFLASRRRREA